MSSISQTSFAQSTATRDQRVVLAAAFTVCAWASAFIVIRSVHASFTPGALALGRLLVGGTALTAVMLTRGTWVRPTGREWALTSVCGVLWFAAYNVALNAAERRVDAGTAAMLVNVGPILIAMLAGWLLHEGFPRQLLLGAGIAFGGAILIGVATTSGTPSDLWGVVLCLIAASAYAVGVTAQKPALARLSALQVTQMACMVATLVCLPYSGQLASDLGHAQTSHLLAVVYLGLVPTAAAFGTWAYALSHTTAGRMSVTTYLVPPLTILAGWPLLGERPPALALLGGLIALSGVALTRRRGPKPLPAS